MNQPENAMEDPQEIFGKIFGGGTCCRRARGPSAYAKRVKFIVTGLVEWTKEGTC